MARTDNLNNFLTDVADAIREKKGTTDTIPASSFDTEIASIESGGVDLTEYFKTSNFSNPSSGNTLNSQIVKKVVSPIDCSGLNSLSYAFSGSLLNEIPQLINTSEITNGERIFQSCKNITTIPWFDTSKIEKMDYMFYGCANLISIPNIDTSKVTNMYYMFHSCQKLTITPDIDTSSATNMSSMFYNCNNLTTALDYDTKNASSMDSMFYYCSNLTTAPNYNTENVSSMGSMFYGCTKLTTAPNYDTHNVELIDKCFYNCSNLTTAPEFDFSKVKRCKDMFYGCSKLTTIGALKDLGKAYPTSLGANDYYSGIRFSSAPLTIQSAIKILNGLYDIASAGVQPQQIAFNYNTMNQLESSLEGQEAIANAQAKGWSVS